MYNYQLQFLVVVLAGWINRHQQDVIEYLKEENRVYREQLGGKRPRFSDEQRRRLAAKAKTLGRSALRSLDSIVTPDTLRGPVRDGVVDAKDLDGRSSH